VGISEEIHRIPPERARAPETTLQKNGVASEASGGSESLPSLTLLPCFSPAPHPLVRMTCISKSRIFLRSVLR